MRCFVTIKPADKIRAQSAMEYLMTYGWAILIIAVVLGALFQLGVFNSSSFSPRAPPGACQVFRPSGPGTTTNINLMGVCTGLLPQYVGQFNGQSSYIDIGNGALLNIPATVTVSVWARYNAYGGGGLAYSVVVIKGDNGFWNYVMEDPNNKIRFRVRAGTTDNWAWDANTLTLNSWHHLVGTYDGANIKMYKNGGLVGIMPQTGALTMNSVTAKFGTYQGTNYNFNGSIANIQVYNTSLSANEIQALYVSGMGGAPLLLQNLVGWWPLNGNSNDYSGNNNNGVPTAVTFTSQYGK